MHSRPRCLPSSTKHWTGWGNSPSREGVAGRGREFLTNVLASGPVKVTEIENEARTACLLGPDQVIGQSKPFRSARKVLGIVPYQRKGEKRAVGSGPYQCIHPGMLSIRGYRMS